jgi:hypothetical protein
MKALTVKQPWAYLICADIKDVENRTWKTNFRGRVLIHAGASCDSRCGNLLTLFTMEQWNEMNKMKHLPVKRKIVEEYLDKSAIIGSVEIVDCVGASPDMVDCFGTPLSVWAEPNCFLWVLENPILFKKPILNMKGKLSFWESGHEVCHICGQPADLICAICGEYFCPNCSSHYNQFTQIDYDCCKRCEDVMKEGE